MPPSTGRRKEKKIQSNQSMPRDDVCVAEACQRPGDLPSSSPPVGHLHARREAPGGALSLNLFFFFSLSFLFALEFGGPERTSIHQPLTQPPPGRSLAAAH